MGDKDKPKPAPSKNVPKDGQVIMAIMKEMGIPEYEPKTIIQLTEFVYRYGSTILEEAKIFANNSKKKAIDLDDVKLALQLQNENTFTMPPPREVALECARLKNNSPLPLIKPPCGLRLPADRHCLSSPNYVLKIGTRKATVVKRTNFTANKQTVGIPKVITKLPPTSGTNGQKTVLKPKIQITQNIQIQSSSVASNEAMQEDSQESAKRKRDETDD